MYNTFTAVLNFNVTVWSTTMSVTQMEHVLTHTIQGQLPFTALCPPIILCSWNLGAIFCCPQNCSWPFHQFSFHLPNSFICCLLVGWGLCISPLLLLLLLGILWLIVWENKEWSFNLPWLAGWCLWGWRGPILWICSFTWGKKLWDECSPLWGWECAKGPCSNDACLLDTVKSEKKDFVFISQFQMENSIRYEHWKVRK